MGRLVDEAVDADHDARLGLHLALVAIGRLLDLALLETRLDRRQRPAQGVDLLERRRRGRLQLVGQRST